MRKVLYLLLITTMISSAFAVAPAGTKYETNGDYVYGFVEKTMNEFNTLLFGAKTTGTSTIIKTTDTACYINALEYNVKDATVKQTIGTEITIKSATFILTLIGTTTEIPNLYIKALTSLTNIPTTATQCISTGQFINAVHCTFTGDGTATCPAGKTIQCQYNNLCLCCPAGTEFDSNTGKCVTHEQNTATYVNCIDTTIGIAAVNTQDTPCWGSLDYVETNPSYPHIKNYCYKYSDGTLYNGDLADVNCGTWDYAGSKRGTRCDVGYACGVEGTSSTAGKCCPLSTPTSSNGYCCPTNSPSYSNGYCCPSGKTYTNGACS